MTVNNGNLFPVLITATCMESRFALVETTPPATQAWGGGGGGTLYVSFSSKGVMFDTPSRLIQRKPVNGL